MAASVARAAAAFAAVVAEPTYTPAILAIERKTISITAYLFQYLTDIRLLAPTHCQRTLYDDIIDQKQLECLPSPGRYHVARRSTAARGTVHAVLIQIPAASFKAEK